MKHLRLFLSFLIFAFFFSGCSSFDESCIIEQPTKANKVQTKLEWAVATANQAANQILKPTSRTEKRIADFSDIKIIGESTSRNSEDTLIYVVNFKDNNGFALISAKDYSNPVIAVVPEGSYDPAIGTGNPGFNMFVSEAKANAARIGKLDPIWGNDPSTPYIENGKYVRYKRSTLEEIKIEPRLGEEFRWNQLGIKGGENIYGYFCPNKTAGCAPIAMGSVIAYYLGKNNIKTSIEYTFPERQRDNEIISWAEIFNHKSALEIYHDKSIHWGECACSPSTHNTIAHFIRQLGKDAYTGYRADSVSSTSVTRIPLTLRKYLNGYTVSSRLSFKDVSIKTAMQEGVAIIGGTRGDESHAWVIDGLSYKRILEERYESDITLSIEPSTPKYDWKLVSSEIKESILCYSHWGWGGDYDGWFDNSYYEPEKTSGNVGNPYITRHCVTIKE